VESATTTTETATTESARPSDAGEAAVALHARCTTIVITAEDTMTISVAALLKAFISETLLRSGPAAIRALGAAFGGSAFAGPAFAGPAFAGPATLATITPVPIGHLAIAIGHAHAMCRVVRPRRSAQPSSVVVPEPKTIEE
jgi:hypothetical protein